MNNEELTKKLEDGILTMDEFDKEVKETSDKIYDVYWEARKQIIQTFQAFMTAHEVIRFYTDEDHYPVQVKYVNNYSYDENTIDVTVKSIEISRYKVVYIITEDDNDIELTELSTEDLFKLIADAFEALEYQDEISDEEDEDEE